MVYTARDVATNPSQALGAVQTLEPDPELIALPAPPKRERALTVATMCFTSVAAVLLAFSLRSEASYALTSGTPTDLGDLAQLGAPQPATANHYVRGAGNLGTQGAIRYGRAAESDSFRLAPVAGNDKLWVEIRVPEGFEGPRFIPPSSFAGRLVPLSQAGLRHSGLGASVSERTGVSMPEDAWILIDGSSPRASRWALALSIVFSSFALWNVIGIARLLMRVRDPEREAGDAPGASQT